MNFGYIPAVIARLDRRANTMRASLSIIATALCLTVFAAGAVSNTAFAEDQKKPSAAQQAQRDRMTSCNADATTKNLTGDARKSFMSDCLSGKTGSDTATLTP